MNIFGVGLPEVTVILILALIIFGPKKLPELGKQLGKTLKSLKTASNEFQNEIDKVINETDNNISKKDLDEIKVKNNISDQTETKVIEEKENTLNETKSNISNDSE
tara:strand:+ start:237 stop:554 length:318 start_codon:yes stop_codon:yes gene_type:complete